MIKVAFVCHGNICRSPLAEFLMKDKVKKLGVEDKFHIESFGTSYEEYGNPVYPPVKRLLSAMNINTESNTNIEDKEGVTMSDNDGVNTDESNAL